MSWMQTYTGRQFYPLEPTPGDVVIEDIAHALSLVCRFGGHVDRFYSVAEHSVLLSHAVDDEHALWALLHDSAEAYIGDMVRPLKHKLANYQAVEYHLLLVIALKFGLDWRGGELPAPVKDADNRILLDERAALMSTTQHEWVQDVDGTQPLGIPVQGWEPRYAEEAFLDRFAELTGTSR